VHAEVERIFLGAARATSGTSSRRTTTAVSSRSSIWTKPLDSELVRAREMVVELEQPGTDGVRQLGVPVKLVADAGARRRGPGPSLGEQTDEVLAAPRLLRPRRLLR